MVVEKQDLLMQGIKLTRLKLVFIHATGNGRPGMNTFLPLGSCDIMNETHELSGTQFPHQQNDERLFECPVILYVTSR